MNLQTVHDVIIKPAHKLLPKEMYSNRAVAMLFAIGLQESRFQYRRQIRGPAKGFWQFESGGGVAGVLNHPASKEHVLDVLHKLQYPITRNTIHEALADNDILACCFARLLLWTDPNPLPDDSDSAWDYYIRNWRPGKPHSETWSNFWAQANHEVQYATRRVEVLQ